jgi:hypothetical protein
MTSDQGPPLEELSAVELRGDSFESEYIAIRGGRMRAIPSTTVRDGEENADVRSRLT